MRKLKRWIVFSGLSLLGSGIFSSCKASNVSVQTASDVTKTQQQTTRQLAEGEMILVGIVDDAAKSSITLRLDNGETITLLSEGVEVVGEGSLTIGDWVEVVYVDEKAIQIIKK